MRIEIVGQEKPEESVLRVRLEYDDRGGVNVVSVEKDGSFGYYLFGITEEGALARYESISEELGLQLDECGYIIMEDK